jgi:hypothetical protein
MEINKGRFVKGDIEHSKKVSRDLTGKIANKARGWKGEEAGYVAKHMWIGKHHGKASKCENPNCVSKNPKRFEWANISGNYLRDVSDYKMLCPSCHRRMDYGDKCKRGHLFDEANTKIRKGWRVCRKCQSQRQNEYNKRKRKEKCDQ